MLITETMITDGRKTRKIVILTLNVQKKFTDNTE